MWYVGVDGCRAGWLAVWQNAEGRMAYSVFADFRKLLEFMPRGSVLLVDMPIGLPWSQCPTREADVLARKLLGIRRSSIFSPPCREASRLITHDRANAENRRVVGRGLSIQAHGISRRIRDLDECLLSGAACDHEVFESHPEVAFMIAAGSPMKHAKRKREGRAERLAVVRKICPKSEEVYFDISRSYRRKDVASDDALDAIMLCLTAVMSKGTLGSMPAVPPKDELGLPMAIWYYDFSKEQGAEE